MNQHLVANAVVGVTGTTLAALTSHDAAIFSGVSAGCWMLWQLACSIYDRFKKK